jgi:diguanylate cyclase (GGDEF)-like protein
LIEDATMIWAIRDLSIAFKFFLAAIPLFFFAILLGILVGGGLKVTEDGLRDVVHISWVEQNDARDLRRHANLSHQGLFRFVAWSSAGLNGETLETLNKEINTGFETVSTGLADFNHWADLTNGELQSVARASARWTNYTRTARDVLDIGRDDPSLATVMLGGAHDEFQAAMVDLSDLNDSIYKRADDNTEQVLRVASRTQGVLVVGAAALLVVTSLVTFLLYNLVLAPVSAVTKALLAEAEGKTEVSLPATLRKDEIGQMVEAIAQFRERTEIANKTMSHLARHDALTGLPNRFHFREKVEAKLADLESYNGPFTLLLLDLDRFKIVNDTRGHAAGDEVLKQVANRLRDLVGPQDTVCRLGGDEFAIILSGQCGPVEIETIARRLADEIGKPYALSSEPVVIGTSIGIAIAPQDGQDVSVLLKRADLALYQAKHKGRDTFCFFEEFAEHQSNNRRQLETDLSTALANGQLELFYQPIVSAKNRALVSLEALIRWNHPVRGQVPPCEFIPLAEDMGLMVAIGDWIVQEACTEAARWPKTVSVAVNISALQIRNGSLLPSVRRSLLSSGLDPHRLEIELTESILLQDTDLTLTTLQALRHMGVRISLDDFGTGFNSLQYLRCFPVDKIKVDQSFVRDDSPVSGAIIRAIAELGKSLNLSIVAEGIETPEQYEKVRDSGCTEIQGYFISRPAPIRALREAEIGLEYHPAAA